MARRVAVIGAGSSGLTCIKCCLEEGLEPVCFESSDDIGGLWRFKEIPEPERSSTYRSLVTNTSKEMMCFSDLPMPAHFPNFMHNSQLLQYLQLYAAHFNLLQHIHFQTTVLTVKQRPDFACSGQWEVLTEDRDGLKKIHIFDAVLVCTGHYTKPVMPLKDFPGFETFKGEYCHSSEYKDPEPYKGKKVMVVGIGNSGGDIAVELSRVAKKTFLSTRQGAWVLSRISLKGRPIDMIGVTRLLGLVTLLLPRRLVNWACERELNQKYDHRLYGLMPKNRFLDQRPLVNDDLPGCILLGGLVIKPNIQEFQGSNVVFEDETVEEQIDTVIFCTGYTHNFPFLSTSLFTGPSFNLTLYKHVLPPMLEHPTLAIIGLIEAWGPIMPVVEMQARWATRVISGNLFLPYYVVFNQMKNHFDVIFPRYPCPKHADLQLEYIPYMDELANELGVRPNILRLLLTDPRLGFSVLFGPCTPYQFRLRGPGKWAGARNAILTVWDRVSKPMMTRVVPEPRPSRLPKLLVLSTLLVAAIYAGKRHSKLLESPMAALNNWRMYVPAAVLRVLKI
uniref:Flavin-containing monooxygenase n=1 Tax=Scleropages formosus TaxID=113540 RepID=A0A8C9VVL5_SCLFO